MSPATFDYRGPIRLVVFDWAGTTVDHGCFAPVIPFQKSFRSRGVEISLAEARGPMGMHKKDHIRTILQMADVTERWRTVHGRDWTEEDVEDLFQRFVPFQMEVLPECTQLVSGVLECVAWLRSRGIRIATSTGYFGAAAAYVYDAARKQGYEPDRNYSGGDVSEGRPAPYMIWRAMEALGVYPPAAVVKVGDTIPDVGEGRNAGVWTVGVVATGSDVGLTESEWTALSLEERRQRSEPVRRKLLDAGAHCVVESVRDLPAILPVLEDNILNGNRP